MSRRLFATRGRDRATLWLWDWVSAAAATPTLYPIVEQLLDGRLPIRWLLAAMTLGAAFMTRRLHITSLAPSTVCATIFVFFVPVHRRTFALGQLRSAHSDDWSGASDARHDELMAGSWSMSCSAADETAAWLHDAARQLAIPTAEQRDP